MITETTEGERLATEGEEELTKVQDYAIRNSYDIALRKEEFEWVVIFITHHGKATGSLYAHAVETGVKKLLYGKLKIIPLLWEKNDLARMSNDALRAFVREAVTKIPTRHLLYLEANLSRDGVETAWTEAFLTELEVPIVLFSGSEKAGSMAGEQFAQMENVMAVCQHSSTNMLWSKKVYLDKFYRWWKKRPLL
ncbi:hypothetical protein LC593_16810 [Nostoc sp. CHAB 5844]|nr:hypothetical protein [Nostoc sp. CHAB 5844]